MPKGKPKDKKLALLKKEVVDFQTQVRNAKDPEEKAFRQEQLRKAQADLAKYLQNLPE